MKILVLGSGAREHAICHKLKSSPKVTEIFCAPGNAGIAELTTILNIDILDNAKILETVKQHAIDLVFVGPEAPLVNGVVDELTAHNIMVFGPTKAGAQLEGSKIFTKSLCAKYDIPTAAFGTFNEPISAIAYLDNVEFPIVVKADGLAAGKGVIIAETHAEAVATIEEMFSGKFGAAGNNIVIEEFLVGPEASFFAISDGTNVVSFGTAEDHKRVGENDTGLNTGGMGAFSPSVHIDAQMERRIMDEIIIPTVNGLKADGILYKGVLFAGLILTNSGPKLLEYNARFGDPETEVLMPRLKTDLVDIIISAISGKLNTIQIEFTKDAALCVVMAAKNYPEDYIKGAPIDLSMTTEISGSYIYHAGTKIEGGKLVSNGGRVLTISATASSLKEAQTNAYQVVKSVIFPDGFYRNDIGNKALKD